MTYKIVRHFMNASNRTIKTGLTLAEAQEHCRDPETSSRTATSSTGKARTRKHGQWFDGYSEEVVKTRTRDSVSQRRAIARAKHWVF